jgi:hypothetical protein
MLFDLLTTCCLMFCFVWKLWEDSWFVSAVTYFPFSPELVFWFAYFISGFYKLQTHTISSSIFRTACDAELILLGHVANSNWFVLHCLSQSLVHLFYYVSLWTLLWSSCHRDLVVILMTRLYVDLHMAYLDLKTGYPNWFLVVFPQFLPGRCCDNPSN